VNLSESRLPCYLKGLIVSNPIMRTGREQSRASGFQGRGRSIVGNTLEGNNERVISVSEHTREGNTMKGIFVTKGGRGSSFRHRENDYPGTQVKTPPGT